MIYPKKKHTVARFMGKYIICLLKKSFYLVHLKGMRNLQERPAGIPVILYANHSSWWDGFIAYLITSYLLKSEDYLIMDYRQLRKYRFFRYLGAFSIDKNNPSSALKTLQYSADLIRNSDKCLWIFPQGEMKHQDKRPLNFLSGISKLARFTENACLIPVGFRYEFLAEQRPEVFISAGDPYIYDKNTDDKNLTLFLETRLTSILDEIKADVTDNNLNGYKVILNGKTSRNKIIDYFCK